MLRVLCLQRGFQGPELGELYVTFTRSIDWNSVIWPHLTPRGGWEVELPDKIQDAQLNLNFRYMTYIFSV